jgi:hypothetical protein
LQLGANHPASTHVYSRVARNEEAPTMNHARCDLCIRAHGCALRHMAALSLPHVAAAAVAPGSDSQREHLVRRALRGSGASPGFVEDWIFAGALVDADATRMTDAIVAQGRVDLALLSRDCRHYVGPAIDIDFTAAA